MLNSLWTPTIVGGMSLPHCLVMAPMTRDRSTQEGVPTELNAEYYAQRASHALIITEGTQPSADGQGYLLTPGIHNDEQVAGRRKVIDAVHAAGGRSGSPTPTTPPTGARRSPRRRSDPRA
jgi:N-ethylmaleimide reductase